VGVTVTKVVTVPFPSSMTLVTVAIQWDLPPDGGARGYVDFTAPYPLLGAADGSIIPPFTQRAHLTAAGTGEIELPATNDPQWSPTGWAYTVSARIGGQTITGTLQLDYQTASVQLADLLQVDGTAVAGTSYILTSQRSVASGVAGLDADGDVIDADGNKVGGSGAINETIVNAKGDLIAATAADTVARVAVGSNGQYLKADSAQTSGLAWDTLTASDVSDSTTVGRAVLTAADAAAGRTAIGAEASGVAAALVDDLSGVTNASTARTNLGLGGAAILSVGTTTGTVAAGDDARITGALQRATGGTVTADLTVADNATATKAYRFKVSGGSLDLDAAGEDLYLSAYPNADFTGTQRTYARYEADTQLAHLLGRHLIAAGAFDGSGVADLDPSTGVAAVGAKNSLTNVRFCGFKATAGAPSTGTWTTGDVVLDSAGAWHLCTAGGTPGTWTTPATGGASIVTTHGYVTSGNITPQNTAGSWAALTGGPTFAIAAAVDDEIEFEWASLMERNLSTFYDACVLVSGSPVRYASSGTGTAAVEGDPGYYPDVPSYIGHAGPFAFTAESGDISGGNITIGFATKSGGSGQLFASASFPLRYRLVNYGPTA
jgi:hypothetical protein